MDKFKENLLKVIDNKDNPYHPFVWIHGEPKIGKDVYIGGFSEINASGSSIDIGDECDIASFVVINCLDSHMRAIEKTFKVETKPIIIGHHVFIGTHSAILGGCIIGHHSVIGAGVVIKNTHIPPHSLVIRENNGRLIVKPHYYEN